MVTELYTHCWRLIESGSGRVCQAGDTTDLISEMDSEERRVARPVIFLVERNRRD